MIGRALERVTSAHELSREEMREVVCGMMGGDADERLCAALLAALRTRGETLDEIVGAAEAIRGLAVPLPPAPVGAVDTCGTGGDKSGTFNISTAAALVCAASGTPVAKHGNRRATSECGSAEVLEALGVPLELAPARMAESVHQVGIGFLFARACHPAFAAIAPVRAALPIPTLFNRLGPLTNPMAVRRHLLGVGRADHAEVAVRALAALGAESAWVVHSEDGLDELSTCAPTRVWSLRTGRIEEFVVEPGKLFPQARLEDLRGGDAARNAACIRSVLAGDEGPARDVVLLNAGAALCAAAHPEATDLAAGVTLASRAVDSGSARELLARWVAFCARALEADR